MSNTIYTGKIFLPQADVPVAYIDNKPIRLDKIWYKYFNDTYRNTRLGTSALNGILSNNNLSESGTTVQVISGSTLQINGTLNVGGSGAFTFGGSAPDDGKLLIGHNSNGTYQEGNLVSADGTVTIANNAGEIDLSTDASSVQDNSLLVVDLLG